MSDNDKELLVDALYIGAAMALTWLLIKPISYAILWLGGAL